MKFYVFRLLIDCIIIYIGTKVLSPILDNDKDKYGTKTDVIFIGLLLLVAIFGWSAIINIIRIFKVVWYYVAVK